MKRKSGPKFATEADLCAAFIAALPADWTPYAETAGWDILLVHKTGVQIGIQAKLAFNTHVLHQAAEEHYNWKFGPDFRAVLVPDTGGLAWIAARLGITVIHPLADHWPKERFRFVPQLPGESIHSPPYEEWFDQLPIERHTLPEYVPDVPAGASAPVQLTDWKIKALKIAVILNERGYVTRTDFKALKLDHRRFVDQGWIVVSEGGWVKGKFWPGFEAQHPKVIEQIRADAPKWMPEAAPRHGPLFAEASA